MTDNRKAVRWKITGRVQGVFFRAFTRDAARALGVAGWVRNLPDGSVEARAAGAPEKLDQLESKLRQGPPASKVDGVQREPLDPEEARELTGDFEVRH
jgi:acylphosphatase